MASQNLVLGLAFAALIAAALIAAGPDSVMTGLVVGKELSFVSTDFNALLDSKIYFSSNYKTAFYITGNLPMQCKDVFYSRPTNPGSYCANALDYDSNLLYTKETNELWKRDQTYVTSGNELTCYCFVRIGSALPSASDSTAVLSELLQLAPNLKLDYLISWASGRVSTPRNVVVNNPPTIFSPIRQPAESTLPVTAPQIGSVPVVPVPISIPNEFWPHFYLLPLNKQIDIPLHPRLGSGPQNQLSVTQGVNDVVVRLANGQSASINPSRTGLQYVGTSGLQACVKESVIVFFNNPPAELRETAVGGVCDPTGVTMVGASILNGETGHSFDGLLPTGYSGTVKYHPNYAGPKGGYEYSLNYQKSSTDTPTPVWYVQSPFESFSKRLVKKTSGNVIVRVYSSLVGNYIEGNPQWGAMFWFKEEPAPDGTLQETSITADHTPLRVSGTPPGTLGSSGRLASSVGLGTSGAVGSVSSSSPSTISISGMTLYNLNKWPVGFSNPDTSDKAVKDFVVGKSAGKFLMTENGLPPGEKQGVTISSQDDPSGNSYSLIQLDGSTLKAVTGCPLASVSTGPEASPSADCEPQRLMTRSLVNYVLDEGAAEDFTKDKKCNVEQVDANKLCLVCGGVGVAACAKAVGPDGTPVKPAGAAGAGPVALTPVQKQKLEKDGWAGDGLCTDFKVAVTPGTFAGKPDTDQVAFTVKLHAPAAAPSGSSTAPAPAGSPLQAPSGGAAAASSNPPALRVTVALMALQPAKVKPEAKADASSVAGKAEPGITANCPAESCKTKSECTLQNPSKQICPDNKVCCIEVAETFSSDSELVFATNTPPDAPAASPQLVPSSQATLYKNYCLNKDFFATSTEGNSAWDKAACDELPKGQADLLVKAFNDKQPASISISLNEMKIITSTGSGKLPAYAKTPKDPKTPSTGGADKAKTAPQELISLQDGVPFSDSVISVDVDAESFYVDGLSFATASAKAPAAAASKPTWLKLSGKALDGKDASFYVHKNDKVRVVIFVRQWFSATETASGTTKTVKKYCSTSIQPIKLGDIASLLRNVGEKADYGITADLVEVPKAEPKPVTVPPRAPPSGTGSGGAAPRGSDGPRGSGGSGSTYTPVTTDAQCKTSGGTCTDVSKGTCTRTGAICPGAANIVCCKTGTYKASAPVRSCSYNSGVNPLVREGYCTQFSGCSWRPVNIACGCNTVGPHSGGGNSVVFQGYPGQQLGTNCNSFCASIASKAGRKLIGDQTSSTLGSCT